MKESNSSFTSKTQRKNYMLHLQKMGEILVNLPQAELAKIPLKEELLDAILTAQRLNSHEAKRRQLQYIGRLMRHIDSEPIQQALDKLQLTANQSKVLFHQIEEWRDILISSGDTALTQFVKEYPEANPQQLRQLLRKAQRDKLSNTDQGADTLLFRYLRSVLNK